MGTRCSGPMTAHPTSPTGATRRSRPGPPPQAPPAPPAAGAAEQVTTKNPRQEAQHAHLHAFYVEDRAIENHESSPSQSSPVIAEGLRAFRAGLGADAIQVDPGGTTFAADIQSAVRPWGGSYCSYQLGVDGPFWVMPDLGPSQDDFNRRLARADGLKAAPDPNLGGAVNLVRPTLADPDRLHAAQQADAQHRASFETFVTSRGLNLRSLPVD